MNHPKVIDINDLVNAIATGELKHAATIVGTLGGNAVARLRRDISPTVSTLVRRAGMRGR